MKQVILFTVVFLCTLIVASVSYPVSWYKVRDLGTLGGNSGDATDINELGQVTGWSNSPSGSDHAFIWLPSPAYGLSSGMHDLGTLTGYRSRAESINDKGQVAGYASIAGDGDHAFLWLPEPDYGLSAGMHDLGTIGQVGGESIASGINNNGQVVGRSSCPGIGGPHAFLWLPRPKYGKPAGMNDLGSFGYGHSWAWDIANNEAVVGSADTSNGSSQAFVWRPLSSGLPIDIGSPYGSSSSARSINEFGDIVGYIENRPAMWSHEVPHFLDDRSGEASDINDNGQVVGLIHLGYYSYASLWENNRYYDLQTRISIHSGWDLQHALAINNSGRIVGYGITQTGDRHPFLLIPLPEPSTIGVFGLSLILLLRRLRKFIA
jgi:probable HAF family extracellular repeat protein